MQDDYFEKVRESVENLETRVARIGIPYANLGSCAFEGCGATISYSINKGEAGTVHVVAEIYGEHSSVRGQQNRTDRRWLVSQSFHVACYSEAGMPYGEPLDGVKFNKRNRNVRPDSVKR